MKNQKREMDLLPTIRIIVRDAIKDGLIRSVRLSEFEQQCRTLTGKDLEDYLQRLWDEL